MAKEFRRFSSCGASQLLLCLILTLSLFSYFLHLHPHSALAPGISSILLPQDTAINHVTSSPRRPLPDANYTSSNQIIQQQLLSHLDRSKDYVRSLRRSKVIMSRNDTAIQATNELQEITRCYLLSKYGKVHATNLIAMTLQFPPVMIAANPHLQDCLTSENTRTVFIELAPMMMLPHAFYTITEIAHTFRAGKFHRNAPHVLQSNIEAEYRGGVVYMEYDRWYPHEKYTLGFAGRGGANAFYISIENNTMAHGPGTDRGGKDPEADTVFGRILPQSNGVEIVHQMKKQPGGVKPNGFISDQNNFITINSLYMLSQREVRAVLRMFSTHVPTDVRYCHEIERNWTRIREEYAQSRLDALEDDDRQSSHLRRVEKSLPTSCRKYMSGVRR